MNRHPLMLRIHRYTRGQYEHEDALAESEQLACPEEPNCETMRRSPLNSPMHKPSCIDNEYSDHTRSPKVTWYTFVLARLLIML